MNMKKNGFFKAISVLLSVLIIFSCFTVSFSAFERKKYPVVFVDGMDSTPIYKYYPDGSSKMITDISKDDINKCLKDVKKYCLDNAFSFKPKETLFGEVAGVIVDSLFDGFACDKDGNPYPYSGIKWSYEVLEFNPTLNAYEFNYDWRISPFEVARQLHEYIRLVKEKEGTDKINIRCFSMGGAITMTYIATYGYDEIAGLFFDSTATFGAGIAGKLVSKQIAFDSYSVVRYVASFIPTLVEKDISDLINEAVQILYKTGLLDMTVKGVEKFVDTYIDEVYYCFLGELVGQLPGVWALVPNEYYALGKRAILNTTKNAKLIEVCDKYQNEVQLKAKDILKSADEAGIRIGVLSKYNIQVAPCVSDLKVQSDNTIDTVYTSFGATCSERDSQLPVGYVQAKFKEENYISPDRTIDASTCLFPDRTWFVRDKNHDEKYDRLYVDLSEFVFNNDEKVTVKTSSSFPQFFTKNSSTGEIEILRDTSSPKFTVPGLFELIISLIITLYNIITKR